MKPTGKSEKGRILLNNEAYEYYVVEIRGELYYQVKVKCGVYPHNGRTKYKTVTEKDYLQLEKSLLDLSRGIIMSDKSVTIEQLANSWLKYKYDRVERATFDKLESAVNSHIIPEIGGLLLEKVTNATLQSYINMLAKSGNLMNGQGLSYNSLRNIRSVLHDMFDYAFYVLDLIPKNYVKKVSIPRYAQKPKGTKELGTHELKVFLDEVNRKNEKGYVYYYRNAALFMLNTGLRPCEIFGLTRDTVDLENNTVRIEKDRVRVRKRTASGKAGSGYETYLADYVKNKPSLRLVVLNDAARQALVESLESHESELCFPDTDGKIVNPVTFNNHFRQMCRACGLEGISPYSLRHTFASRCFYSSLDINHLTKLMGHATPMITNSTYIHQQADKESLIREAINNLY